MEKNHTVRDSLFAVVSVLALVAAALVVQDGGFALAIGLVAVAILAPLVPFVFITYEEHDVGRPSGRAHPR
jgi:hypothetical protein